MNLIQSYQVANLQFGNEFANFNKLVVFIEKKIYIHGFDDAFLLTFNSNFVLLQYKNSYVFRGFLYKALNNVIIFVILFVFM